MKVHHVSIKRIIEEFGDPFEDGVFEIDGQETEVCLSVDKVLQSIKQKDWTLYGEERIGCIDWHTRRVAYLVHNNWSDPIELDVGIPSLDFHQHRVVDGWHRIAACLINKRKRVKALVSGETAYATRLLRQHRGQQS